MSQKLPNCHQSYTVSAIYVIIAHIVKPYYIRPGSFIEFSFVVCREIAMEQKSSIQFRVKLSKTFTETFEILQKDSEDEVV